MFPILWSHSLDRHWRRLSAAALLATAFAVIPAARADTLSLAGLKGQKVSVEVQVEGAVTDKVDKTIQSKLERILEDNEITTLDQAQTAEVKKNWRKYINASGDGAIDADGYRKFISQYHIKAIIVVTVSADVVPGIADYFSATAKANIRLVSEDAKVSSATSAPLGVPGSAACDAITRDSALNNALEVSLDDSCGKIGLQVADPARPRSVKLSLTGPVAAPGGAGVTSSSADASAISLASLETGSWHGEKVTCSAQSVGGSYAAVAGYIVDTDFHRHPARMYGSKIHLIDLTSHQEANTLWCYQVGKKESYENGDDSRRVRDCLFLNNWRYLAAVSGSDLFFWDVEEGKALSQIHLAGNPGDIKLTFVRSEAGCFVVAGGEAYRVERSTH